MVLIDGRKVAGVLKNNVKHRVDKLKEQGITPGLAVILVGERKDSQTYVRMKQKTCQYLGIHTESVLLPDTVEEEEICRHIKRLNNDDSIHGILIQLPLPKHISEENVLQIVSPNKDVDGFHYGSLGRLAVRENPLFVPCTPEGCIYLLDHYNIQIEGKNAVVVGRSKIVGMPLALLLLSRNATVTICHSRTKDLKSHIQNCDILIACCGIPKLIQKDWVKEGVVIIDVGINAVDDPSRKRGYRLVGDVDYENVKDKASFCTPVPGGVGPMTIAMLMEHTVRAAENSIKSCSL